MGEEDFRRRIQAESALDKGLKLFQIIKKCEGQFVNEEVVENNGNRELIRKIIQSSAELLEKGIITPKEIIIVEDTQKIIRCYDKRSQGEPLTEEEKLIMQGEGEIIKFLKESEEKENTSQMLAVYNEFIVNQREGFLNIMNFTNSIINRLINDGTISEFIEMRARIKAPVSAIQNDSKKALDDIFGIEIIGAREEELLIIREKLENVMQKTKQRNHNKNNGYKATHICYAFKKDKINSLNSPNINENYLPVIEFQFKTTEVAARCKYGKQADHSGYKNVNPQNIQKEYDEGKMRIFTTVPTMWERDRYKGDMILLTEEEILKKLYPFLKLRRNIEGR